MNKGSIIVNKKKSDILNLLINKKVTFILENIIDILPKELEKFKPDIKDSSLALEYNKNDYQLIEIIEILRKNNLKFTEINTDEGDLEDVFLNLIKSVSYTHLRAHET